MSHRRLVAALALAAALVATGTVAAARPAGAAAGQVLSATITRTAYGIPHIVARDFTSLGFGQGYAAAEDTICLLYDTVVTGRGERSRYFGPAARYTDEVMSSGTNLEADTLFGDLRNRQVVEGLLADPVRGPGQQVRALVRGYVAGVNRYVAAVGGARGITDPTCRGAAWVTPVTELDLYYGIYGANLLASTGVFLPQIASASPPTLSDPGLPELPSPGGFGPVPVDQPSAATLLRLLGAAARTPFGSNGTALGGEATTTGRGMVLGNPHFPWQGRYRFTQSHLTIPGVYDVAGAMLTGSPVVNIGWNSGVAWTHTVSVAYRFTPYEYRTLPGLPTTYLTAKGPKELERRAVTVKVKRPDGTLGTTTRHLYRTDEGYVLDAPKVLMGWTPLSFFALRDANAEHLRTLDAFFEMGKARTVQQLAAAQDRTAGIPWVNTMAADRAGNALYADNSVVPNVPDELVARCATPIGLVLFQLVGLPALDGTRAGGSCAWRRDPDAARPGIFGPANLPDTVRRDWVVNANDSYWLPNPRQPLEGFDRIIGNERSERSLRTRMVYRYLLDGPARFSPARLRDVQYSNRVLAAELARAGGDLQKVCLAADGGAACGVLERWDGHSDTTSVGAHIFREFWLRTPAQRWEVPFDPADPVNTPRDLAETSPDVIRAMRDALAHLRERGIPLDAPLGTLQVAGDPYAPRLPVGGGPGEEGNANVVDTRNPTTHTDLPYPVTYGSSHLQAVAFTDGGVDASTVLTYGLSTDPTRPSSADQTRLFSREQWVHFPFTAAEIRRAAVRTYTVRTSSVTVGQSE
jgi:acyl-homoserine-lactone acylase